MEPDEWTCGRCHATNGPADRCEYCGFKRPSGAFVQTSDTPAPVSRNCPHDDHPLMANGWCEYGNGYPMTRSCPHVCDQCRKPLTWQGTCLKCDAYAPGDRYEYDEKNPHWQLVVNGPFTILPLEEQARLAADFAVTMGKIAAAMTLRPAPKPTPRPAGWTAESGDMATRSAKARVMLEAYRAYLKATGVDQENLERRTTP